MDLMSIDEIAELAGVKRRGVVQWVTDGKLKVRDKQARPGQKGPPVSLFDREEVDTFLAERIAPRTTVLQRAPAETAPAPEPKRLPAPATQIAGAIAAAVAEQFTRVTLVPLTEKPRLTMKEAVQLGYQASDLKWRVKTGLLENVGTAKRYRFRLRDLLQL